MRGRAKAKQTMVARELKYSSPSTDLTALQRELASSDASATRLVPEPADEVDPDLEDDDDGPWAAAR